MTRSLDSLLHTAAATGILSVTLLLGGMAYRHEARAQPYSTAATEVADALLLSGATLGGASLALSVVGVFPRYRE